MRKGNVLKPFMVKCQSKQTLLMKKGREGRWIDSENYDEVVKLEGWKSVSNKKINDLLDWKASPSRDQDGLNENNPNVPTEHQLIYRQNRRKKWQKLKQAFTAGHNDFGRAVEYSISIESMSSIDDDNRGITFRVALDFWYDTDILRLFATEDAHDIVDNIIDRAERQATEGNLWHHKTKQTWGEEARIFPFKIFNAISEEPISWMIEVMPRMSRKGIPLSKSQRFKYANIHEHVELFATLPFELNREEYPFVLRMVTFEIGVNGSMQSNLVNLFLKERPNGCRNATQEKDKSGTGSCECDPCKVCTGFMSCLWRSLGTCGSSVKRCLGGLACCQGKRLERSDDLVYDDYELKWAIGLDAFTRESNDYRLKHEGQPGRDVFSTTFIPESSKDLQFLNYENKGTYSTRSKTIIFIESPYMENLMKYIGISTVMLWALYFLPILDSGDAVNTVLVLALTEVALLFVLPDSETVFTMTEKIIVSQSLYAFIVLWYVVEYVAYDLEDQESERVRRVQRILLYLNTAVTIGTAIYILWGYRRHEKRKQRLKSRFHFFTRSKLTEAQEYFTQMSAKMKTLGKRDQRWKKYLKAADFDELEPILQPHRDDDNAHDHIIANYVKSTSILLQSLIESKRRKHRQHRK
mmetsp:Transcript_23675/g.57344  ORF Transcript_23675/g.57344 Transcript_23675/m.57344 type:complete len:638 (-) Transcript_23675:673-2586(-)